MTPIVAVKETSEGRGHSFLQPSSAFRWLYCRAAPAYEAKAVKENPKLAKASAYADEGTLAHSVAEQALNLMFKEHLEPEEIIPLIEDEALREPIGVYLNAVRDTYFEEPEEYRVEAPVNMDMITGVENTWGTADCWLLSAGELHVFDYKHGVGYLVKAEANPQLMLYALGILSDRNLSGVSTIHLHIVQPRKNNVSTWTQTRNELLSYAPDYRISGISAKEIADKGVESAEALDFDPDVERCQWCKARTICPAYNGKLNDGSGLPLKLPMPSDTEQMSKSLRIAPMLKQWIEDVEKEAKRMLLDGVAIPGFKLVEGGLGPRRWADEKEAEETLIRMKIKQPDMYVRKLVSPTQAEKLKKAGIIGPRQWLSLEEMIVRKRGEPQVVKQEDPGKEIAYTPEVFSEDGNPALTQ